MLKKIGYTLLFAISTLQAEAGTQLKFPFAGCTVELLDSTGAAAANSKSDAYTKALQPFDLQIRLGKADATEKDYLARAAEQVRNWPAEEQQQLKQSFAEIETFLKNHKVKLKLPATIQLIKTAGKEEFEAEGYTRGNRIILHTSAQQSIDAHLVAHELFHVYSRFNELKRDKVYAVFGFKKCNRINTSEAMNNKVITNPDCPFIEHYIRVNVNGQPKDLVLQLYSQRDYKEEYNLGDYMNVGLLEVSGTDKSKKPVMKDGAGVLYQIDQVPELMTQISGNTPYILHPEEISAEHFAMWVIGRQVPQPEFFDRLQKALMP
ncbi:eCIS core domain-containing protein [Taibaiella helva]|uniref:eCIS core domain-containing protein n=1 Tax=Taibaiella helva TaxID=2301235 RepID=UPI000E568646|nr:DUF4157 domain-containing protein [Taibaiella helva]